MCDAKASDFLESKADGGPAFPVPETPNYSGTPDPGMTLRDWFAGQALACVQSCIDFQWGAMQERRDEASAFTAKMAYEIADAMLKERG